MRNVALLAVILVTALTSSTTAAVDPLRVFIRSGPKSHGPGAHDYPRFLKEWVPLLNDRGARATGSDDFPTRTQLAETDVLVLHKQEAGNIDPADRQNLNEFLARGGGLVVIHAGTVSRDPDWFKGIVGGSWRNGTTKWLEGPMQLYFTDRDSPITKDVSNWAMDDEIYYDMDILPEARILAAAYTPKPLGRNPAAQKRAEELTGGGKRVSVYDVQPQMWTYERTVAGGRSPYRAFVSIPGHLYENFNLQGAVLYASCEPCPLCLASALWARIDRVFFAADRHGAAAAGFDDALFYEYFDGSRTDLMPVTRGDLPASDAPFKAWGANKERTEY